MKNTPVILIAEDDTGHFELVKRNLWRSCVDCDIIHFRDGLGVMDFLEGGSKVATFDPNASYLLILDIRMPNMDGHEVLRRIKSDRLLKKIPVIILTNTDKKGEIEACYRDGCSFYIPKPANYMEFMNAVEKLGAFLSLDSLRAPQVRML